MLGIRSELMYHSSNVDQAMFSLSEAFPNNFKTAEKGNFILNLGFQNYSQSRVFVLAEGINYTHKDNDKVVKLWDPLDLLDVEGKEDSIDVTINDLTSYTTQHSVEIYIGQIGRAGKMSDFKEVKGLERIGNNLSDCGFYEYGQIVEDSGWGLSIKNLTTQETYQKSRDIHACWARGEQSAPGTFIPQLGEIKAFLIEYLFLNGKTNDDVLCDKCLETHPGSTQREIWNEITFGLNSKLFGVDKTKQEFYLASDF